MKKIVSMVMGLAAGVAFAVEQPDVQIVTFSSQGADKYADGTTIRDGECYALVWTKNETFGGITPKGAPRNSEDKVLYIGALAKDGKCPYVEFHVAKSCFKDGETGGKFGLWVLDTRVVLNGEVQSFGWSEGKGVVSYAAPASDAMVAVSFGAVTPGAIIASGVAVNGSTTAEDVVPPEIDDIQIAQDAAGVSRVQIGLKNTVFGAKYSIIGSEAVTMENARKGAVSTGTGGRMVVNAPSFGQYYRAVAE